MAENGIDLGFTRARFPAGTHICQIFVEPGEREDSLVRFLASGVRSGERSVCFSEQVGPETIGAGLAREGISLEEATARGALALYRADDVYFRGGVFDPDVMLRRLTEFHAGAVADGFANARAIGEMSATVQRVPGGGRLLEYEARVSLLLREHPVTSVCQYDARAFDGATIMEVLKVHPMMVVRGNVVHNPFFVPPEEYLS